MRRQWFLVAAAAVLLFGFNACGQRFDAARAYDRNAVLAACLGQVVARSLPRERRTLRGTMGRIEACMAERRLPGHAIYDSGSRGVRYAYEADQPVLRF